MNIGQAIKLMRTSREMSQIQLAEAAECSANYLSLVERGRRTPSLKYIDNVASALGVTSADLFVLAGERKNQGSDPERDDLLNTLRELLLVLASPER